MKRAVEQCRGIREASVSAKTSIDTWAKVSKGTGTEKSFARDGSMSSQHQEGGKITRGKSQKVAWEWILKQPD